LIAKRLFDLASSTIALLLLLPVFVAIAIWIKVESPGPVMFRQVRVGLRGREFRIHKFRTMHVNAPKMGPEITVGVDPRITRSGRFLRHYRLDELPQLIDVILGDMSIVGPRPEVPKYMAAYPEDLRTKILSVRPGISDWASIHFTEESEMLANAADPEQTYIERILPIKQRHYIEYVESRSFSGDLAIIFATIKKLVARR
jgi:lipopolysaccharide/colanic/teichoic acid biosynthesis glycosyltransferase